MRKSIQYSIRWILIILAILLAALYAESAAAELRTFIKEYTYRASKADGRDSSQSIALREVKKLLLEALTADLTNIKEARDLQLTKDQIAALSAGIVKMEVEDERWDDRTYWLKARVAANSDEVIKRIDAIRKDQEKVKELEKIRIQSDDLLTENERLRKELVTAKGKKILSVKAAYDQSIKEIRAVDWYEKGYASANLGMYDQAIRDFSTAIELNSKEAGPYYNRGLAYTKLRQHARAIQDYSRAIELDPIFEVAYIQRGFAFFSLGQRDQAIELDPKQAVAYYNLARIYSLKDNHEKAIQDLNKAVQLYPDIKNMVKKENDFDRIRQQPDFIKLIGP